MKLYRVKLKGLTGSVVTTAYGKPYVVADNPTDALIKVQTYLKENKIGFSGDREMDTIELLAEEGDYPKCRVQLFIYCDKPEYEVEISKVIHEEQQRKHRISERHD